MMDLFLKTEKKKNYMKNMYNCVVCFCKIGFNNIFFYKSLLHMHIFIWHQGWFYLLFIISVVKFEVDLISYLCGQKSF